jgi:branched-chain amino acid aminotransferase
VTQPIRVWMNGGVTEAATLPVGARSGLGAFETLRTFQGQPFRLEAHLSRLRQALGFLDIVLTETAGDLTRAVREVCAGQATDVRLRITVLDGEPPCRLVEAYPLALPAPEAYAEGVAVVSVPWTGGGTGHKLVSYAPFVLARRAAVRRGAHEALLVTPRGVVVEAAHANVFAVLDGEVLTPPLSDGPLPGITRAIVVRELGVSVREVRLVLTALRAAEEVFLTSSVAGILPVAMIDGQAVGQGRPGPVTTALMARYAALPVVHAVRRHG